MEQILIPGIVSLGCLFVPKTQSQLIEASRVFASGMAGTSLCLISWKTFQASILLISPGLAFCAGLSVYGTYKTFTELKRFYDQNSQGQMPLPGN